MTLGILWIVLAVPLFIGYAISNPKKKIWLYLGILAGAVGLIIIIAGSIAYLNTA